MRGEREFAASRTDAAGGQSFAVHVVFTDPESTLAALKTAGRLARGLAADIRVLVTQVVPYPAPLDCPPVRAGFAERRLRRLAAAAGLPVSVGFYLCRDRFEALRGALAPQSLVVIGGKKRWWPNPERRLAKWLQAAGHQVIFTMRRLH